MTVVHFTGAADTARKRTFDAVEIIVPGERSTLRVAYRNASGHDRETRLNGHRVAVIPANQPHSLQPQRARPRRANGGRPGGRESEAIVIRLDRRFFEHEAGEMGLAPPRLIERYAAVDPFLREIGEELRGELRCDGPSEPYLQSLAAIIAVHLVRHYCAAPIAGAPALPSGKLARVQAYISAHFDEAIALRRLAAVAHLSAFHFARLFKRTTGQPPHLYITARRIERAKELLSSGAIPLADVAVRVGFQTQSHFTTVFHQHTGQTPRMFRLGRRPPGRPDD